LLAAADDLSDRSLSCGSRLAELAGEWKAETDYHFLLACHYLLHRQYNDVAGVISRWPDAVDGKDDWRQIYLECCLSLCQGRVPILPIKADLINVAGGDEELVGVAWESLAIRTAFLKKEDQGCWESCQGLVDQGYTTERILKIMLASSSNVNIDVENSGWEPPNVLPESCLPGLFFLLMKQGRQEAAVAMLNKYKNPHPEMLSGWWLSASFWLRPIRGWIA